MEKILINNKEYTIEDIETIVKEHEINKKENKEIEKILDILSKEDLKAIQNMELDYIYCVEDLRMYLIYLDIYDNYTLDAIYNHIKSGKSLDDLC